MDLDSSLGLSSSAFGGAYRGKRVLVTGHTGFKGSWLCEWLLALGAEVTGLALEPNTNPSLFEQLKLAERIDHRIGDVRNLDLVTKVVAETKPDFVFHLAAQPLVRLSYDQPVETYATNVMGTINVLEALRRYKDGLKGEKVEELKGANPSVPQPFNASTYGRVIAAVMITTDKCYENKEWVHSYREEDPMGGYDPYSSSKGAAELAISAYRRSFFSRSPESKSKLEGGSKTDVRLASARAGNVIGGGDWALDRIVPDCIRSLQRGESIPVRNKVATRPWQHVLEPLSGYLLLASELARQSKSEVQSPSSAKTALTFDSGHGLRALEGAFNFGPALASNRTVAELVQEVLKHWPGRWEDRSDPKAVHEAKLLNLATDKAHHLLGWSPAWNFAETIHRTIAWYRAADAAGSSSANIHALTIDQIRAYTAAAASAGVSWAR